MLWVVAAESLAQTSQSKKPDAVWREISRPQLPAPTFSHDHRIRRLRLHPNASTGNAKADDTTFNPTDTTDLPRVDALTSCAIGMASADCNLTKMPCPTVYIYPNTPVVDGGPRPKGISFAHAFGMPMKEYPGVYASNQFNLAHVMLYRLQHSSHCRVTQNASEADLFVIPVLSNPKSGDTWGALCWQPNLWGRAVIRGEGGNTLRFLPHLNAATAKRHLFFISKGHYVASGGVSCDWIRGEPPAAPFFADVQRFAYSHSYAGYKYGKRTWGLPGAPVVDGRVVSVPYPSWIHWSSKAFGGGAAPWQQFDKRPFRIHFVAGMHGKQIMLRKRLFEDCKALQKPACRAVDYFSEDVMIEKQRSVFCLEPEGDSPFRKSVYDSIVSGW